MRTDRIIHTIDVHVAGLPVRVVTGGVPVTPGATMEERRQHFIQTRDDLRTLLMCEPRGNGWMSGAILHPSTRADCDWGMLFIEVTGVLPMCGAGTIGVATALVDTGMVPVVEPVTRLRLDAPIGPIDVEVTVSEGKARAVTIRNVDSYVHELDRVVEVPGVGPVRCDIAFGGNTYAFIERPQADLTSAELIATGTRIMDAVNAQVELPAAAGSSAACEHVMFIDPSSTPQHVRQTLINHPGWLDRSPGGTGTSAYLAVLHARGELGLNADVVSESFVGSTFTGRLVGERTQNGRTVVTPMITGSGWITALTQQVLDPDDPFPEGFAI